MSSSTNNYAAAILAATMTVAILWRVTHPLKSKSKQRKAEWIAEKALRKRAGGAVAPNPNAQGQPPSSSKQSKPKEPKKKQPPAAAPLSDPRRKAALLVRAALPAGCCVPEPALRPRPSSGTSSGAAAGVVAEEPTPSGPATKTYLYVIGGRLRGRTLTTVRRAPSPPSPPLEDKVFHLLDLLLDCFFFVARAVALCVSWSLRPPGRAPRLGDARVGALPESR